ncbi:MAG: hypothetical protein EBR82_63565 [Caulobacteraceae bacterium]|nr:hypothetical protein [Caulobacteraceae bacterium]
MAACGVAGQGRHDPVRRGTAWQGGAGSVWRATVGCGVSRFGEAGWFRLGRLRRREVWHGRHGPVWPGMVWRGTAGLGRVWRGKVF